MTRRILHVAQPVEAGVAVMVLALATHQRDRGFDVTIACPASGWLPERAAAAGLRVVPWEATRAPGPSVLREVRALARVVRDVAPDLVHLHSSKAGLAGRLAVRGRRATIFMPQAWSFHAVRGNARRLARQWERVATRWHDRTVAVSEAERAVGVAAGIGGPMVVIPNGIDTRRFVPLDAAARAETRAALGMPDGLVAVCVGRLCEQKGQDVAVRAWRSVRAAVPTAELVFVGEGPDRAALEAAAAPGVTLVGARSDVERWLGAADLVVAPSRWEGFSIALLEAVSCGASIVATDVAGAREALRDDGGAVVPVDDADAFAAAVVERLQQPARRARESAANRSASAEYDLGVVCAAFEQLYADVLAERAARS